MILTTIEQLKKEASAIKNPIKVTFPFGGNVMDTINPQKNPNLEKGFAVNGNIIAFVPEDLILRVIPYMDGIVKILKDNGYVHKSIYVPFSNDI